MKFKLVLFLIINTFTQAVCAKNTLDSLLIALDNAIVESSLYSSKKEARINELREQRKGFELLSIYEYKINAQLYKEYRTYLCDSAVYYLNRNIVVAKHLNDVLLENESEQQLAYLLASTGMYKEGVDVLESIDRSRLSPHLLLNYFNTFVHLYGELAFYTQDKVSSERYRRISNNYRDSLQNILTPDDPLFNIIKESELRNNNHYAEALAVNDSQISQRTFGTPEYAVSAFFRAMTYKEEGNSVEEKRYLALSALSDIYSSTKDHASLWMLAQLLYEEGDIERAYSYIRFSWNETVFFNARLRSLQSSGIRSIIDKTYQANIEQKNKQLEYYLLTISVLFVLLIVALIYIYSQMRKLAVAQRDLQITNEKLKLLNEELKQTNEKLHSTNIELSESNHIKEEYIGRFIELCSTYINKLDKYRRMVSKKITDGKTAELLKITRSEDALEEELRELYVNFDTAFLHLFPDFVKKFNGLLKEDSPIVLKKGELLNTELRIFALIRLGIDDSSQIADFLRYSVNTIYNYRAKVKNKTRVVRDDFEAIVKAIR